MGQQNERMRERKLGSLRVFFKMDGGNAIYE